MIKLYYDPTSISCQKVLLVLAELLLSWKGEYVNLQEGEQHSDAFRALNKKSQVPVLDHDGWIINESSIICEYLTTLTLSQSIFPEDAKQRAIVQYLAYHISSCLQSASVYLTCVVLNRPFQLLQPRKQVLSQINQIEDPVLRQNRLECYKNGIESSDFTSSIDKHLEILDEMNQALKGKLWVCGDHYTIADATLFPYILRLHHLGMSGIVEKYSDVNDWYHRCVSRSSYDTAILSSIPHNFVKLGQEAGSTLMPIIKTLVG